MKNKKTVAMGLTNGHDRGCAIMIGGELSIAINEERISRIKRDMSDRLAIKSINYCMSHLNLNWEEVDVITYTTTDVKDVMRDQIKKMVPVEFKGTIEFIPHHMAHAYSTFGGSDFDESAVVVADAMGSVLSKDNEMPNWYTKDEPTVEGRDWAEGYTIYHFKNRKDLPVEVYKKWVQFPFLEQEEFLDKGHENSVGFYYINGALQLVYSPTSNSWQAGKLMGLASFANKDWVNSQPEYSTRTEDDLHIPIGQIWPHISWDTDFQSKADIAGLYQREQELNSLHLVKLAKKFTKSNNICVAGGSFLNCNTNELIIKSELFNDQYFTPPADDSGISIGCAMHASTLAGSKLPKKQMIPYSGKEYTDLEIESAISKNPKVRVIKHNTIEDAADAAASLIAANKVIGWFQGGSEMGPRALGNRSILANPATSWMEEYINSEIKKREWYRPFAPSVLSDKVGEIFELDEFSPYMLVTTTVKEEWRNRIPAVTHTDGTSRYQSVHPDWNYPYHTLITKLYEKTGIPVVLNTSFNGPKEPIVESPEDAINTFKTEGLKSIFIGKYQLT